MKVLSTNRRKIGAIALIAAGIIAVAVPFLLHPPLNANTSTTTTSGNGSGNTNTNTNPTSNSGSNPNSGSNSGSGGTETGSCSGDKENNDPTGDPSHSKGHGHAYAHGHSKGDDRDEDPLHAIMNRLARLGSDSPAFHHHNSTRTDNGLGQENSQGNTHAASNHGDPCSDDNEDETD